MKSMTGSDCRQLNKVTKWHDNIAQSILWSTKIYLRRVRGVNTDDTESATKSKTEEVTQEPMKFETGWFRQRK